MLFRKRPVPPSAWPTAPSPAPSNLASFALTGVPERERSGLPCPVTRPTEVLTNVVSLFQLHSHPLGHHSVNAARERPIKEHDRHSWVLQSKSQHFHTPKDSLKTRGASVSAFAITPLPPLTFTQQPNSLIYSQLLAFLLATEGCSAAPPPGYSSPCSHVRVLIRLRGHPVPTCILGALTMPGFLSWDTPSPPPLRHGTQHDAYLALSLLFLFATPPHRCIPATLASREHLLGKWTEEDRGQPI